METAYFSETVVSTYESTQHQNSEHHCYHHQENLKFPENLLYTMCRGRRDKTEVYHMETGTKRLKVGISWSGE